MPIKRAPVSFAGTTLNNANRSAYFMSEQGVLDTPGHELVSVERIGAYPSFVRAQPPKGKAFPITLNLLTFTEEQARLLRDLFDPAGGLQRLILEDADTVQRRVQCLALRFLEVEPPLRYTAALWAPDPRLLAETLSTSTIANLTAAANLAPNPNNAGDTDAEPTLRVSVGALKNPTQAWAKTREVRYAWRGLAHPQWLLELTGGWDTAALIHGTVRALINDVAGITASQTTIPYDTGQNGNPPVAGMGFIDTEQVSWTGGGGAASGTLTGVTRGIGGTAAAAHADNASIINSEMLDNGADIAVFVDGVQVPAEKVNVNGIDTATTKVWIEIAEANARYATLAESIDAGETAWDVAEEAHGIAVGDYIAIINNTLAWELEYVTAVDGRTLTVTRGVRGTTAGAITGGRLYRMNHRIQIAYYWTGAPVRPANPDPPLIDLALSTNLRWVWPTAPMWQDANKKAGGFRRIIYPGSTAERSLMANSLAHKTVLDVFNDAGTVKARWTDAEPNAGQEAFDAIEFYAACGIKAAAGAIEFDAVLGWPFFFQVIGRDLSGYEKPLARLRGHESGTSHEPGTDASMTYTNKQITPSDILQAVIFRARNAIVTNVEASGADYELVNGLLTNGLMTQPFGLDGTARIMGIVARLKEGTAGTVQARMRLGKVTSDGQGPFIWGPFAHNVGGTTYRPVCFFGSVSPVPGAGDYYLHLEEDTGTGAVQASRSTEILYPRGNRWQFNGTVWVEQSDNLWFAILSDEAENQQENDVRTAEIVKLHNIELSFDDTDRTPIASPLAAEDAYYFDDTIATGARSMRLRFLERWADVTGQTVEINVAAKTVIHSKRSESIRFALEPLDDEWLLYAPGNNVVTVTPNGGAADEDWTSEHRSTWQA